eukprot:snap_masked-scaffold10_size831480-processed-gene-4.8 protein:Tk01826 transcript:snap_masked-scaffold10_size831480-processed-gene-4.8-mRNA-1 annotation:"hypothetical protein DAPPUDRAFT_302580"
MEQVPRAQGSENQSDCICCGQYTCDSFFRRMLMAKKVPSEWARSMSHLLHLNQHDPRLWAAVRKEVLIPPANHSFPGVSYNLKTSVDENPSMGQGQTIQRLFEHKHNGFFIECGAHDGETVSNTLFLERHLGWTGLLVEASQRLIPQLIGANRQAWIVPNCLSLSPTVTEVAFGTIDRNGKILSLNPGGSHEGFLSCDQSTTICYPLFSILKALNVSHVDYFSLDVEGFELDILKTIPFDQVDITALSVEFIHEEESFSKGSKKKLEDFMTSKGYTNRAEIKNSKNFANDFIFVQDGFREDIVLSNVQSYGYAGTWT